MEEFLPPFKEKDIDFETAMLLLTVNNLAITKVVYKTLAGMLEEQIGKPKAEIIRLMQIEIQQESIAIMSQLPRARE